jgi:hypothetical protein
MQKCRGGRSIIKLIWIWIFQRLMYVGGVLVLPSATFFSLSAFFLYVRATLDGYHVKGSNKRKACGQGCEKIELTDARRPNWQNVIGPGEVLAQRVGRVFGVELRQGVQGSYFAVTTVCLDSLISAGFACFCRG